MHNDVCLLYFDIGTCFYMFEQIKIKHFICETHGKLWGDDHQLTHLYIHIDCSRNVLLKFTSRIYIRFSLFCLNIFNLSFELTYTWSGFLLWVYIETQSRRHRAHKQTLKEKYSCKGWIVKECIGDNYDQTITCSCAILHMKVDTTTVNETWIL